jgi:hypothetical protein
MDHYNLVQSGVAMDEDYNLFDSFHVVTDHPRMSRKELEDAYRGAWESFYDTDNLKHVLARARDNNYWKTIAFCLMWYKNSLMEPRHPMVSGFYRKRGRKEVRPGTPVMSLPAFALRRVREIAEGFKKRVGLFFELQELWWLTRRPDDRSFRIVTGFTEALNDARAKIAASDINTSYARWCDDMNAVRVSLMERLSAYYDSSDLRGRSKRKLNRLIEDMNAYFETMNIGEYYDRNVANLTGYLSRNIDVAEETILKPVRQRRSMTRLWSTTWDRLKHGRIISLAISTPRIAINLLRDVLMSLFFTYRFFMRDT